MLKFFIHLNIQNCLKTSQALKKGAVIGKKNRLCSKAHKIWQFCKDSHQKNICWGAILSTDNILFSTCMVRFCMSSMGTPTLRFSRGLLERVFIWWVTWKLRWFMLHNTGMCVFTTLCLKEKVSLRSKIPAAFWGLF